MKVAGFAALFAALSAGCWTRTLATSGDPESRADIELIVRGASGITSLELDAEHVYWTTGARHGGGVFRADKAPGANPTKLGDGVDPLALAIDRGGKRQHVYWADESSIAAVAKTGGSPRGLLEVDDPVTMLAVTDGDLLIATDPPGVGSRLLRIEIASSTERPSATLAGDAPVIAHGADGVYIGTSQSMFRIDREGFAQLLFDVEAPITAIVFDGETGYFAESTKIKRFTQTGRPEPIADVAGATTSLAVDDRFVYWNGLDRDARTGAIYQHDKRTGHRHTVTEADAPTSLILDGGYLYWSDIDRGHIARRRVQY